MDTEISKTTDSNRYKQCLYLIFQFIINGKISKNNKNKRITSLNYQDQLGMKLLIYQMVLTQLKIIKIIFFLDH